MRELLESLSKVARKQGWFLFFRRMPNTGNAEQDRAQLKIYFEKVMDSYFDGNPPKVDRRNEPERY